MNDYSIQNDESQQGSIHLLRAVGDFRGRAAQTQSADDGSDSDIVRHVCGSIDCHTQTLRLSTRDKSVDCIPRADIALVPCGYACLCENCAN